MQTFCIKCQRPPTPPHSPPSPPPPPFSLCWTLKSNILSVWAVTQWTLGFSTLQKSWYFLQWDYVTVDMLHMDYGSDPGGKNFTAEILQWACERLHQQGLGCLLEEREGEAAVGWVRIRNNQLFGIRNRFSATFRKLILANVELSASV